MTEPTPDDPTGWMPRPSDAWIPPEVDTHHPSPARVYDYWLGGKDNYAVDREIGDQVATVAPWVLDGVKANRGFLTRAVAAMARRGITQFLDIGAGLPTSPNVHETAEAIQPDVRVAYVDNDALVLPHSRALLASRAARTLVLDGDLKNPTGILSSAQLRGFLDWRRPVGLLLVAVTHFLSDEDDPADIVATLGDALPAGSYLALSHTTDSVDAPRRAADVRAAASLYTTGGVPFYVRPREEILPLFDGFQLLDPPGLTPANHWTDGDDSTLAEPPASILAGVGQRMP